MFYVYDQFSYICICIEFLVLFYFSTYSGHKRNLHLVKMEEKYTCFNINNWIYSILNIQSIFSHVALCFYHVLESNMS